MAGSVSYAQLPGATLREQLKSLEQLHGVEIRGLDRVRDEPARQTAGDLRRQVMGLLQNYSYVVLQSEDQDVRGVRILASQGPAADVRGTGTRRPAPSAAKREDGIDAQTISTTLVGYAGHEYDMTLAIDTGVEAVVLPASMRAVLGFDDGADLQDKIIRTAGGAVEAKAGLLPAVRVGAAVAENVEVAFVPDGSGGRALLGNSFLKQFKVSFDNETAQLMILPRY